MAERTIILDGFSKTFAMTGWRMGYGVMPTIWYLTSRGEGQIRTRARPVVQRAGIEALSGPRRTSDEMAPSSRADET